MSYRAQGLPIALALLVAFPASAQEDQGDATARRGELAHLRSRMILESNPRLEFDPTTMLVRFHASQGEAERQSIRSWVGGGTLRTYPGLPGLELIAVSGDVEAAIETVEPFVQYAEPNYVQRLDQTPNDTYFGLQYGIHNTGQDIRGVTGVADADIDGVEAWDLSTGDPNFVVAIIDSGTQWSHPDLSANIWSNPGEVINGVDDDGNGYVDDVRGWDFYSGDNDPDDDDGHGTHTAGTVGAVGNNGIGVAGVNWNCKMAPLRFIGPFGGYTSDAIAAVQYCTTNNIKVSCNSWGGGGFSQGLYDAINASKSVGHVFAAAAGNDGTNTDSLPHYPSSYSLGNIISVAATDNRDLIASFSNYGVNSVDIGAPGVDIASTYNGSSYVWSSGTSMACPHVAGVAALVYAAEPGLGWSGVVDRILNTARPTSAMSGRCATGGVLNAFDALNAGGGGGGDVTPPADPTGLGASGGDSTVSLDWNDNSESDLAGYRVYRSTSSGSGYAEISSGLLSGSAFTDNGVSNGTTYYYVVTAEDTSGNESGASNEASATPDGGDVTPPSAPTGLGAAAGDSTVDLDWDNNSEGDLAGYRVYRSTSSGGGYVEISSGLLSSSAFTDNGVSNGTTYYYVVTAEDTTGNESGASNEAEATPSGGGGGGPVTLFYDGFESGSFSAGGWIRSGNTQISTKADRTGTYGARIKRSSYIARGINTSGYSSIEVSFSRRTRNMESSEALNFEWSGNGGSTWSPIEVTNATSWSTKTFTLPASAGNNPNFVLRLRTNANRNNERADVDDIEVIGSN